MAGIFEQLRLCSLMILLVGMAIGAASSSAAADSLTAPVIVVQPQSQQVDLLSTVALQVIPTGGPLSYQWQFNGLNIARATNDTLILNSIQSLSFGNYRVKVSNAAG